MQRRHVRLYTVCILVFISLFAAHAALAQRDPDTDGDGLPDSVDACPRESGPRENGGCPLPTPVPDSDGDGLVDTADNCPNASGPRENGGCPLPTPVPDSDGDGLADTADNCPNASGPRENGGCPLPTPVPDSDGDGLADTADNCPNASGPRENGGCPLPTPVPDSDGDGLPDNADNCPNAFGPRENGGCPLPTPTPFPAIVPLSGSVEPGLMQPTQGPITSTAPGCFLRNVGTTPYPVVYYDASLNFSTVDYPDYINWVQGVDYNDSTSAPEIQAVSDDIVAIMAPDAFQYVEKILNVPVPGLGLVQVYRLWLGGWVIPGAFPGEIQLILGTPPCPEELLIGTPDFDITIPELDFDFLPDGIRLADIIGPTLAPWGAGDADASNGTPALSPDFLRGEATCLRVGRGGLAVCLPQSAATDADSPAQDLHFLPVDRGIFGLVDSPDGARPVLMVDDLLLDGAAIAAALLDDAPAAPDAPFAPGRRGSMTFLPNLGIPGMIGFLLNVDGDSLLLPVGVGGDGCTGGIGMLLAGGQAIFCGDLDGDGDTDSADADAYFGADAPGLVFNGIIVFGEDGASVRDPLGRDFDIASEDGSIIAVSLLLPAIQKVREAAARAVACDGSVLPAELAQSFQFCDGSVMPSDAGQIIPVEVFGDGSVVPAEALAALENGAGVGGLSVLLLAEAPGDGSVMPAALSLLPPGTDISGDGSVMPGDVMQAGDGSVFVLLPGDNQLVLGDGSVIPAPLGALFGVVGGQAFLAVPSAAG
ncbi:MAG: thrombospondin type 3 repeat-containing protein [Pleurocapsa minor GSE-CHR-MK-17-07R]|jgi:hypothetical protein|nr:thrombospondin type 3 repeat-containing protein [Pleurocapsa minor GSE-CHR-MK 17-07R]